jgi:chromosome segregation ATPase
MNNMTSFEYLIQQRDERITELSKCLKHALKGRDQLKSDLAEANANLLKCGYDELNKVCNQRDKAISDSKSLEYHIIQLNKIGDQLRAEVSLLRLERDEAVVSSLTAKDSVITELNSLRAEVAERREEMADVVRALGHGCGGLSNGEIVPEINKLRAELNQSNTDRKKLMATVVYTEQERDRLKERLEIETSGETCIKCGGSWNPSLVESGWCIFCIQKETAEDRDLLNIELVGTNDAAHEFRLQIEKLQAEVEIQKGNVVHQQDECSRLRAIIEKIENELAQSQSNFDALLKTNGNTIDESAELKSENQILQEYLNQSNARINRIENDIKDLKLKIIH